MSAGLSAPYSQSIQHNLKPHPLQLRYGVLYESCVRADAIWRNKESAKHMCMYVYVYVYVYVCVCVYVCTCIYTNVYAYADVAVS